MDAQQIYFETMNFITAPIRYFRSLLATAFFMLVMVVVGLIYPLIVHLNGQRVTFIAYAVSFLTVFAVVTFCRVPHYTLFGGALLFVIVCANVLIRDVDFPDSTQNAWLIFGFLVLGHVQRYLRHRNDEKDETATPMGFAAQLNQVRLARRTREYDAMDKQKRAEMIRKYGHNYLTWPE